MSGPTPGQDPTTVQGIVPFGFYPRAFWSVIGLQLGALVSSPVTVTWVGLPADSAIPTADVAWGFQIWLQPLIDAGVPILAATLTGAEVVTNGSWTGTVAGLVAADAYQAYITGPAGFPVFLAGSPIATIG